VDRPLVGTLGSLEYWCTNTSTTPELGGERSNTKSGGGNRYQGGFWGEIGGRAVSATRSTDEFTPPPSPCRARSSWPRARSGRRPSRNRRARGRRASAE